MARFLLVKGAAYILAAQGILSVSGYFVNFWLGRHLGASLYGSYGVLLTVATIINLLLGPGIIQGISKLVAENKENAETIKKEAIRIVLFLSIALGIAYLILSKAIAAWMNDTTLTGYLRLLTLTIPAYLLTAVYSGYLTGTKRFVKQSGVPAVYATARLMLTFLLTYLLSLSGAIIAFVGASVTALLYAMKASSDGTGQKQESASTPHIGKPRLRMDVIKYLTLIALFYGMYALLTNIDLFFIKALTADSATVGYYNAAITIAKIPYFIISSLTLLVMPAIASAVIENKEKVKDAFIRINRYILLILIPVTLLISLTTHHTVALLYKSDYISAAAPLTTLVWAFALATITIISLTALLATGTAAPPLALITIMIVISAALLKSLIPLHGMNGAAAAMLITFLFGAASSALYIMAKFKTYLPIMTGIRTIIACIVVFVIAQQIHFGNKFIVLAEYAFLGSVYFAVLLITREIKKGDIERLRFLLPLK